ncbi:ROK family protein [Bacillus sp. USDA818B3_A]|uniref:ROK family protein n=1 Tax=Bacillus sp. USDA818B3_A TaxID=2698834 RepID=UPI00136D35F7|nr:ROK family protein [Bacillus sp. USDA818B3_A]
MYYGAIEAGGTKFVCAVSDENFDIVDRISIPTTLPNETMQHVYQFFNKYNLISIGIGSFGPIDVNKESGTYGYITTTPKMGWGHFNLVGALEEKYQKPVAFTTDVNAAAYGEYKKGSAKGANSCLYLTIGTGIGGGAVINGKILEGFSHPEMGHVLIRKHQEDSYEGNCPFHKTCLEGLAAGPAIEGRYSKKGHELEHDDHVWKLEAYYIAQALISYTLILRPEKIILGGGVMKQRQLFPLIRAEFKRLLNDYVQTPNLDEYIVPPELEDNAGITGCLLLAKEVSSN